MYTLKKISKTSTAFISLILLLLITNFTIAKDLDLIQKKSFDVKMDQLLTVTSDYGDIIIKAWDNNELSVKIYGDKDAKNNMEFSFDQDEKGVTVIGEKIGSSLLSWFNSIDLKYEVFVPSKFNLDLKTSGGDLSAVDLQGDFHLKTSGGDIYLKNTGGSSTALTSGGDIVLASHSGYSDLNTSGGDIEVNSKFGSVTANTSGGDIFINSSNGKVSAKTSGGDIRLNYNGENQGVELRTSGGDIDVTLPSDLNADVDIRTSGGDLTSKFSNNRMSKVSKSTLKGKFNSGGALLICKTSGGDITVVEN